MAQIEYGDFKTPNEIAQMNDNSSGKISGIESGSHLPEILEKFFPKRYKMSDPMDLRY